MLMMILILFFFLIFNFSKGTTTYFSKGCTQEDADVVKTFMKSHVISYYLLYYILKLTNLFLNRILMHTVQEFSNTKIIMKFVLLQP